MNTLLKIKKNIVNSINQVLGPEMVDVSDISYPPNEEMGDLSLPLFKIKEKTGKDMGEISSLLLNSVKPNKELSSLKIMGPYLNFFLNKEEMISNVLKEVKEAGKNYGQAKAENKKRILLEFSNVNTHKEYHVGHLRNACFGDSVTKILNACGHEAIPISYINDFGIHVAKTLWNFDDFTKDKNVEKMDDKEKGYLLGKMYVDAAQKEKDDPMAKQMIGGVMREIESRKGDYYSLWQKTRQWSIEHFDMIYKDLGIEFKDIFYENDFIEKGRQKIEELTEKGILKMDDGAIIADLKDYGLKVLVCLRSNGTATYAVGDLALAETKTKKFKPDESVYMVDNRQSLYFQQLFKILELSGHEEKMTHLSYDLVKLPDGMMSSRSGNVITYNELKDMVIERATEEIKKRHDDWDEKKTKKVALAVGLGAIKFEMVKVSADNIITFDTEKALSFDGFTSSYIQYAYARIAGIFERVSNSKIKIKKIEPALLKEASEIKLIKKMARWPEAIGRAGNQKDPSEIAKYLYELAKLLNDHYHQVSILNSEEKVKRSRLSLLAGVAQIIENGLGLLGIEVMEEM